MKEAFVLSSEYARKSCLAKIVNAPDDYLVEIGPRNRTVEQNNKLWAILTEISEATGFTTNQWHEQFKKNFLPNQYIDLPDGSIIESRKSTTKLNKNEFSDFIEKIYVYCAEQGLVISKDEHS